MADDFGFEPEKSGSGDEFGFQPEAPAPVAMAKSPGLWERFANLKSAEPRKSSYEGVKDDDLNFIQRLEKKAGDVGLVKPGSEMFSPDSMRQKGLALKTAANTATAGYLPQISAAMKTGSVSGPKYLGARDEMVNELAQTPTGTKAAGMAIGAIPSLVAGGAVSGAAKALPYVGRFLAPATTAAGKILQGGGMAAGAAFLANPGDKPGEYNPTQGGARVENAMKAAPWGAGAGALSAVPDAVDYFKKMASNRALKASGAMLKDYRAFDQKGTLNPSAASDKLNAGQALLDNGVVTPLATLPKIEQRAGDLASTEIGKVNAVYDSLDKNFEKLKNSPVAPSLPTGAKMADAIEQNILAKMQGSVALKGLIPQVQEYADGLKAMGNQPMTFSEARKQIGDFDKLLDWDKEQSVGKQLVKQVRGTMNGVLENSVDAVGKASGFPLYENWKNSKQLFGVAKDVKDMAGDKLFRNEANRYISPSDYATGIGAAMTHAAASHDPLMAAATGLAVGTGNHLMRTYGNSLAATGANQAAKFLAQPGVQQAGASLSKAIPGLSAAGASVKGASSPQPVMQRQQVMSQVRGTQYEAPLAGAKDDHDFALRYFSLSQNDPGFRAALEPKPQ